MINKEKKVSIQITFPKDDAKNLQTLCEAFNAEGIEVTKSQILLTAFRDYLKVVLAVGLQNDKQKEEEPQKENKNA